MDDQTPKKGLNDFSDREMAMQKGFADFRTRLLGPIVRPLSKVGVTPDHLTLLGVLLLIPFAYFFISNPILSSVLLFSYVVCDGIDGPYARITNRENEGGAFADLVADQLGMVVVTLMAIHHQLATPVLAAGYAIIYVIMIAFVIAQNSYGIGTPPILRSKYVLYLTYIVWAIWGTNGFDWVMAIFTAIMVFSTISSFFRLKRHLSTL